MAANKRDWVGGRVASHAELDAADQAFWRRAGPAARFEASLELSLTAWSWDIPMSLPPDLAEMLSVFADAGVRYLVIGGHAVSLHARPRTTKDLDLWLDAAPDNIRRACAALLRFGVPPDIVAELRAARANEIVWMGRIPSRIDFLQRVPGLEFEASWERRTTADVAGVPVQFIGRDDLLTNKRIVGRPQDRRDVRALERAAATELKERGSAGRRKAKTHAVRKR